MNLLFEGDCLEIMKKLSHNSIDLIYLDPPFFSNRKHEVVSFGNKLVFNDEWKYDIDNYLDFMVEVLIKCYRLLKDSGLLFLHCDWHAVHYLKIELDKIFGYKNFRNEIIWKRHNSQNNSKQGTKLFGRMHDSILMYSKSQNYKWNQIYHQYSDDYIKKVYNKIDQVTGERYALSDLSGPGGSSKGNPYFEFLGFKRYWRYNKSKMEKCLKEGKIIQTKPNSLPKLKRYLKEMNGIPLSDMWIDVNSDQVSARRSVSYPTQKPMKLLERIIQCSTNKGDMILDPFCGGGTSLLCASKMGRYWIGIDKNPKAIEVTIQRLQKAGFEKEFELKSKVPYVKLRLNR